MSEPLVFWIPEERDETTQATIEASGDVLDEGEGGRESQEGQTTPVSQEAQVLSPSPGWRRLHVEVSPGVWVDKMVRAR